MLAPTTRFRDLPVQDLEGVTRNFEQLGTALESVETKTYTNVKEFGATGNGGGDDTAAISAAIKAAGTFGTVYMPPGEYVISKALSIPYSAFSLVGAGYRSATLFLANSSNSSLITTPDDKVQREGLLLKDFSIEGNAVHQAGSEPAINIRGMDEARFEGLFIKHPRGNAIQIGQATGGILNTVPKFNNVILRGDATNSQANGIALESGSSDAQVIGCDIGEFKLGSGILVSGHSGYELIGNHCWQNLNGYKIFQGQRGRLVGCLADFSQNWGFIFQNLSEEVTQVIGCQARSSGQAGVNTYDGFIVEGSEAAKACKEMIFTGCRGMGARSRYGLNLAQHVKKVQIVGCDFTENEKEAIHEGSTEVEEISGGPWKKLTTLGYKNSWKDEAATPGEYRKNSLGNVELRGTIASGESGKEAFTLPAGYRPTKVEELPVLASLRNIAELNITTAGVATPTNGPTSEVKTYCTLHNEFSVE